MQNKAWYVVCCVCFTVCCFDYFIFARGVIVDLNVIVDRDSRNVVASSTPSDGHYYFTGIIIRQAGAASKSF